jgi:hypothetical protein
MTRVTVVRSIRAPVDRVFSTVSDISQYSRAVRDIVRFEFLSEVRSGVGTRFRETRLMKGKEHHTELDVTEYASNDRVRMVAANHGIVWDTLFTVAAVNGETRLTTTMDARTRRIPARIMIALMKGNLQRAIGKDMDAVKAYCEA